MHQRRLAKSGGEWRSANIGRHCAGFQFIANRLLPRELTFALKTAYLLVNMTRMIWIHCLQMRCGGVHWWRPPAVKVEYNVTTNHNPGQCTMQHTVCFHRVQSRIHISGELTVQAEMRPLKLRSDLKTWNIKKIINYLSARWPPI